MAPTPKGIHRIRRPEGMEDEVWVSDGLVGMDMTEGHYRERGYEPPFEDLPWQDEDAAASGDRPH